MTSLSKKIIFLLHRMLNEPCASSSERDRALKAAEASRKKLTEVQQLISGMKLDLQGDLYWRYQPQVSPGLQEYIEALSFTHYLEHGTLITLDQVQETLRDSEGGSLFPLPVGDYILGLADLTGELMRYAITTVSQPGGRARANELCTFVRECKADFERLAPHVRDLHKKNRVTAQSLQKIEDAMYAIAVRSAEFDLPQSMMDALVANIYSANKPGYSSYEEDVTMA